MYKTDAAALANLPTDESLPLILRLGVLPFKGAPNAPVTIIEFTDYECPFCARAEATINQILADMPGLVRVALINMPLDFHKNADSAARAAIAAGFQGRYWEMHAMLFSNQRELSEDFYASAAKALGLDIVRFRHDMVSEMTDAILKDCKAAASKQNVMGTPSFLINGVSFVGAQPIEEFKKAIDKELDRAKNVAAVTHLHGEALYQELVRTAPKPKTEADIPSRAAVDLSNAPAIGPKDAPITIVEFTDFECPFCQRANSTIHQLIANNPGKIRLYFCHFPLAFHKNAQLAHQAAEAAKRQGDKMFWAMQDILFANRTNLDEESIMRYAASIGLNMRKFKADLNSKSVRKAVEDNIAAGKAVGVNGTPHFLINGTAVVGAQPLEKFQEALDRELEAAIPYMRRGLRGRAIYESIVRDEMRERERR